MATNRDCDPKRWNAKGGRAIDSKEEIKVLNTHLEAVADHNLKMEQLVGKDYVRDTLNRYKDLEKHLKVFIALKYGVADMDIKTIDQAFLNGFDHYLRSDKNYANISDNKAYRV